MMWSSYFKSNKNKSSSIIQFVRVFLEPMLSSIKCYTYGNRDNIEVRLVLSFKFEKNHIV